jgi:ABC-type sugar transport system substrate-binding protein
MSGRIILTMLFLAAALSLFSCSTKQKEEPRKRIAGIVFQEDQFFRLVLFGMRDAAKRHGVELLEANSNNRPDKEVQLINTYIANKVDAIAIAPLSAKSSVSALERAREKGIPVIVHNMTLESDVAAASIESDQFDIGASTGKAARAYIESRLGGKAKIAILAFQSQLPEQSSMRTNGFKSEVTKLPGVTIVSEQDAWLAEQAVKKVGDILTANPDVRVIWSANEGGTVGAVMAVRNAGKAGKIAVFGTDTSEQLAGFLLDDANILQAITGQRPFEIGTMAVESAVKVLKGEKVEKNVSLPGFLLTRERPDEVKQFKERLKELSK